MYQSEGRRGRRSLAGPDVGRHRHRPAGIYLGGAPEFRLLRRPALFTAVLVTKAEAMIALFVAQFPVFGD